ncbi:MAG: recombination protein O N-terminal domain-containing protein [Porphyromonas sp.]|nr:recombination protein O N-terminal domain-containing protein [Porphyromonas sp.]
MKIRTRAISLTAVKYSDTKSIVHLFTESLGTVSFQIPRVMGKRCSSFRPLYVPLSVVEIVYDHKPLRQIHHIGEIQSLLIPSAPSRSLVANGVAMFLTEFLHRLLAPIQDDGHSDLFLTIASAVEVLDREPDAVLASLHLHLMVKLLDDLGIAPDHTGYEPGYVLQKDEGCYAPSYSSYEPERNSSRLLYEMQIRPIPFAFAMNREERSRLLDMLLSFYDLHFHGVGELKSLSVLKETFS